MWGYGRGPAVAAASSVTFNQGCFKMWGAILALLAAVTLALGIADVIMTIQNYCTPWVSTSPVWCSSTGEPYIWTWVASGIWGSVPIFLAGVFAMCVSANPFSYTRIFALLTILSALVFAPAIIVLTSVELWRGGAAQYMFYGMSNGALVAANILPSYNPYQAKFAIPLVIVILAGIMFLMTGIVTLNLCCCMESLGIYMPPVAEVAAPVRPVVAAAAPAYYPRPQVEYQSDWDPYARYSAPGYIPTRFSGGAGAGFGAGISAGAGLYGGGKFGALGNNFASDFFQSNPASFWK